MDVNIQQANTLATLWAYTERFFQFVSRAIHVIRVCSPSQSAPEKYNEEKKPTRLCAPSEFLNNKKMCLPCLSIIQLVLQNKQTRCVICVSCFIHFDARRAQRIIGFFYLNYPQINEVGSHWLHNRNPLPSLPNPGFRIRSAKYCYIFKNRKRQHLSIIQY